jgi:hypothetical protein
MQPADLTVSIACKCRAPMERLPHARSSLCDLAISPKNSRFDNPPAPLRRVDMPHGHDLRFRTALDRWSGG